MSLEIDRAGESAPRTLRLRWAVPGVELSALGLPSLEELFAPTPALSARRVVLEESPQRTRLAFPLPGTPDARGHLTGRVGPLGTGWLWLSVELRPPWSELLRARFTHPRSASLAEREWNLLCHLRAHGVGAPEPLLVGARGAGLVARRSFLLVRALEDAFPLPRYLRTDGLGAERERTLQALGLTLANLRHARVLLPELSAQDLWVSPSGSGECEVQADAGGPRKNKLPSVSIVALRGGRILARPDDVASAELVERLSRELAPALTEAERARLAERARGQGVAAQARTD